MSKNVKEVSKEELDELLAEGKTVVCDFWATWCGPCRMIAPVMDELAPEYAEKAVFVKIDVDKEEEFAQSLGIMSIPNIFIFEDGEVKCNRVGYANEDTLREFFDENL